MGANWLGGGKVEVIELIGAGGKGMEEMRGVDCCGLWIVDCGLWIVDCVVQKVAMAICLGCAGVGLWCKGKGGRGKEETWWGWGGDGRRC
jgi:hypothetical protein